MPKELNVVNLDFIIPEIRKHKISSACLLVYQSSSIAMSFSVTIAIVTSDYLASEEAIHISNSNACDIIYMHIIYMCILYPYHTGILYLYHMQMC